jgi:hypothetical protein
MIATLRRLASACLFVYASCARASDEPVTSEPAHATAFSSEPEQATSTPSAETTPEPTSASSCPDIPTPPEGLAPACKDLWRDKLCWTRRTNKSPDFEAGLRDALVQQSAEKCAEMLSAKQPELEAVGCWKTSC